MSDTTFKTDHKFKFFVPRGDVPAKVLAGQYAHLDEDAALDGFFCYRGRWYHLSDFLRADVGFLEGAPFRVDGYASDSYFSGVVVQISGDGDRYKAATYFS